LFKDLKICEKKIKIKIKIGGKGFLVITSFHGLN
jgi:hypothetical protein